MTNTEMCIAKLNYNCANRDPESFASAMEGIINIYTTQVSKGLKTDGEIKDFKEMLSIVNYMDNYSDKYQNIIPYFDEKIVSVIDMKNNEDNYEENHAKVA